MDSRRGDRHASEPRAPVARLRQLPPNPAIRRRQPVLYSSTRTSTSDGLPASNRRFLWQLSHPSVRCIALSGAPATAP